MHGEYTNLIYLYKVLTGYSFLFLFKIKNILKIKRVLTNNVEIRSVRQNIKEMEVFNS